jgi:hypothetical protein
MAQERATVVIKIIAGGLVAGILANLSGYLITGRLFHGFQARTPNTWRAAESWAHYLYASGVRLFSCLAIILLQNAVGAMVPPIVRSTLLGGAAFGACLWAAIAAPIILEAALFVNWHRGFVIGLLLDWLALCIIASMIGSIVTGTR